MARRGELSDEQWSGPLAAALPPTEGWRRSVRPLLWQRIRPLLNAARGPRGRPPRHQRRTVDGIVWVLRTGAPWRDLPAHYGKWQSVYACYNRWSKKGVWQAVLEETPPRSRRRGGHDPHVRRACSPARRWRKRGQPHQRLGRSRGGLSSKIHVVVDTLRRPVRLSVTAGHRHDMLMAPLVLEGSQAQHVLADKAYDSDALLAQIVEQGTGAVIAPKSDRNVQRRYDRERYRQRNVVERFSGRIKHYRRIATRYDKNVQNYFTAVTIACILLWL